MRQLTLNYVAEALTELNRIAHLCNSIYVTQQVSSISRTSSGVSASSRPISLT
jgi:hypothetical protein